MKTMTRFISMAALALAGAIITACSGSDDGIGDTPKQPENTDKVVTLKTTVGFGDGSATTRALTAGGVKTFAAGETMALVYTNTSGQTVKAVSDELTDGDIETTGDDATNKKSATFTFHLTEAPDKSKSVSYIYPAAMATADGTENYDALYSQQDGTLATLASSFDLATFSGAWSGGNLPEGTLANQLAILALTLKNDATSGDITSTITGLTVSDGTYTYNVTRSAAAGPIYVAIRPTAGATIKVTATDGTNNYVKTLTGKDYEINNGYNVSWLMTNATPLSETTPMTMEALTDGNIKVYYPKSNMKYSVNGGAKISISSTENPKTITVSAGDKVEFYGNGTSITQYGSSKASNSTRITGGTANVKVYGNIMSLVDEEGFATATTLTAEYTFSNLFSGNTALTDASGLLLPAPTLTIDCYFGMFFGCTSLETAPALPATTLAEACYYGMFHSCSSLTTAPELPATTLAGACYGSMFWECTSLTAAPALPATTLPQDCYVSMFYGCTNLSAVTCLATNISADGCTSGWLDGVAASGTFTKNPSMNDWPRNKSDEDEDIDYGIPSGWTVKDAE